MTEEPDRKKADMTRNELRLLAREITNSLIEDKRFQRMQREQVLNVMVHEDELRRLGAVRAFLEACRHKEIEVSLTPEEGLAFTNADRLGADLSAVLTLHRKDIIRFLTNCRDLEDLAEKRRQQPQVKK